MPAGEAAEEIVPEPSGGLMSEAPAAAGTTPSAAAVARQAEPPTMPALRVAPLVSARRLARVQRASEPAPEPVRRSVERTTGVDLAGVTIHREASSGAAAKQMSARAFTTGGEVHVPQEHGTLESGEGRALVAHELVHVAQQRRLGPALPPEMSSEGRRLESDASSMESAWRSAPEMPLVSRAPAPESSTPAMDPGDAAVAAGLARRQPDGSVTFRAPETAEPPAPVQSQEDTLTTSAPAPVPEAPEQDLEKLADKLYDPLSRRLREELANLRYRAGKLADL